MKRLISLGIIILFILIAGCEKQPPTAVDNTNPTVQNQDTQNLKFDAAKMQKQMEAKLAKLKEMVRQQPESNHPKSLAKTTRGPINVPGDYSTIQEAVDAAADGAVINVTGNYTEDVDISGRNNITINGGGQATITSALYFAFWIQVNSSGVTIKGFNVIGAILIRDSQGISITDNDISGPNDGIDLIRSSNCALSNNAVHDKTAGPSGTGDGIVLYYAGNNTIVNNQSYSNHEEFATGINVYTGSENNDIKNNVTRDNDTGIQVIESNHNSIKNCTISSNSFNGMWLLRSSENEVKNCEISQNAFGFALTQSSNNQIKNVNSHNNYGNGFELYTSTDNTIRNSEADNNGNYGMYFYYDSDNNTIKDCEASGNAACDAKDDGSGNIFTNDQFGSFNCTP
jgi:parallel beta-helix repeat protein